VRRASTLAIFVAVLALTVFAVVAVWPSYPQRYLPGDFWPSGKGIKIGDFERETMRLGLDLQGGTRLVLEANPPADFEGDLDQALESAAEVIERRVNEFGVSESEVSVASGNRIVVQVPGLSLEDTERLIGATAQLEFRTLDEQGNIVPATGVIDGQVIQMSGQFLRNNSFPARAGTTFAVNFETTGVGSQLMGQITTRALQFGELDPRRQLLVYLDDELISQATIQGVITDSGSITGQESFTAARDLSRQLNAGALPVPLQTIQSSEVSATLGDDSVRATVRAGEVGLIAVALFMILMYRLPGVLATAALFIYTFLVLAVFKLWPVTLTLSGIAAFILSVGMAVDANILIFERMKEELRRGRTLNTAIDLGFSRAWSSIRDSNVSTLITCLILYWFGDQFGAAPVKGFALTLAIGVTISMFSAITVTRTFLKMIVGTPIARNGWLFNAEERKSGTIHAGSGLIKFAQWRFFTIGFSAILVIASLVILAIPPTLKGGIEFTSGSVFTIRFTEQNVEQGVLRDYMSEIGYPEARIQGSDDNSYVIRTRELEGAPPLGSDPGPQPEGEIDTITTQLQDRFGSLVRDDFQTVSGTVSSEIARYATLAVVAAALAIFAYIWLQFRKVPNATRYSAAAVIALLHDTVIVLGLFSLLGKVAGTEVDTAFLTALLTIIGFSVHDTIVVFDRIREKLQSDAYLPLEEAVDASLTETLGRSLTTSLTLILTVVAMLLIGGATIQNFLIVLLVGVIAGTYSSVGVAAQLLVIWDRGEIQRLWGGGRKRTTVEDRAPALEPATEV
jgi:protein-export membrane protein SecD/preprotein translocase SecF subunit